MGLFRQTQYCRQKSQMSNLLRHLQLQGLNGQPKGSLKKNTTLLDAFTTVARAQHESRTVQQNEPQHLICSVQTAVNDSSPGTSSSAVNNSSPGTSTSASLPMMQAPRQQTIERYGTAKRISNDMTKKIDRDLLDLFIASYQPFSLVEERAFKKFARWIPGYQLPSRKTISTVMLPALYHQTKAELKMELGPECNYSVCLTTDLWTSRSNESYIAVTGHYMTDDFELKTILLDCRNFQDSHTSENIQEMLTNIVAEWGLTNKINFAVSDNAANIQKAINNIGWRHYGCYGHSLNLIVQDALITVQPILEKVKKIVRYFKRRSTALEKLLKAQMDDKADCIPKRLIQEVPTRWNSSFHMVQRFVELEQYVRATMAILKIDLLIITNEEWQLLSELTKILQPFDQATETISGEKYMTGSLVIVMTRCLLTVCDKFTLEPFYEATKDVVYRLRTELVTRFGLVERSRTFSTCTFLDPRYKLSVFGDQNEAKNTKTHVQEMLVAMIAQESAQEHCLLRRPVATILLMDFGPYSMK